MNISEEELRPMLKIKPTFLKKNGRTLFVVLTIEEYEQLIELFEDAGYSRILREAKRRNANSPTYTATEVKRRLLLKRNRPRRLA